MPPKRKADSFTFGSEDMSKAPRAGVEKASFALFLPNDTLYGCLSLLECHLILLSLMPIT